MSKRKLIAVATAVVLIATPIGFDKATEVIKAWEGFEANAYEDAGSYLTIGYGQRLYNECNGLKKDECTLEKENAEILLQKEVYRIGLLLDKTVKVELSENQRAALISFIYNVGDSAFLQSTLLKKLNAGCYVCVPAELKRWAKIKGTVSRGLENRRRKEVALWKLKS